MGLERLMRSGGAQRIRIRIRATIEGGTPPRPGLLDGVNVDLQGPW